MSDRTRPLARDLTGIGNGYTWKYGEGAAPGGEPAVEPAGEGASEVDEAERLRVLVRHLTSALEDVVALALSGADYKERAILMHRRAVSALSGPVPPRPPLRREER